MALLLLVALVVAGGATLDVFWDWFVLPVFTDLPPLTLGSAMGLSLVVAFFRGVPDDDKDIWESAADATATLAVLWAVALIYHYVLGIGVT
jgi:hypothetical protein